jgi:hypothetical protein
VLPATVLDDELDDNDDADDVDDATVLDELCELDDNEDADDVDDATVLDDDDVSPATVLDDDDVLRELDNVELDDDTLCDVDDVLSEDLLSDDRLDGDDEDEDDADDDDTLDDSDCVEVEHELDDVSPATVELDELLLCEDELMSSSSKPNTINRPSTSPSGGVLDGNVTRDTKSSPG